MPGRAATGGSRRARKRADARPRVGLALAGGGPLGGIYEVGALLAARRLARRRGFERPRRLRRGVVGRVRRRRAGERNLPTQMYRLFIDDGADAA